MFETQEDLYEHENTCDVMKKVFGGQMSQSQSLAEPKSSTICTKPKYSCPMPGCGLAFETMKLLAAHAAEHEE